MPDNLPPSQTVPPPGSAPFVVAGLSYIPLVGVVFGIIAIAWGLALRTRRGQRVAAIGAGGIAFTIAIYGSLFYFGFVQRGGVYDGLRTKMAQSVLNGLVPHIEYYKVVHGEYPPTLEALSKSLPKDAFVFAIDPSGPNGRPFYYQRVDATHYYLRGLGPDGVPFTADDLIPTIEPNARDKLGLLIDRPQSK